MRLTFCTAENFASYKELAFDFTNRGLTLIHGATGSGKSTLCDVVPWILFGKTAKGGAVDEILSWPGDDRTSGTITLTLNDKVFQVMRSRKPNDLMIWEDGGAYRGKDLADTQRIINEKLGFDYETYLSGAYFHEFSQTAQFFTTTAKNRRVICEQLVDLSLPVKLQDKLKKQIKEIRDQVDSHTFESKVLEANLKTLAKAQDNESKKFEFWEKNQAARIAATEVRILTFEERRAIRVEQVIKQNAEKAKSKICSECGAVKTAQAHSHQDSNLEIIQIEHEENPFAAQLKELKAEKNPHTSSTKDFSDEINATNVKLNHHNKQLDALQVKEIDATLLQDAVVEFRGLLIKNTILDVESKTNVLLSKHFDGEIQVEMSIDSDKLEVSITKDGNACSFTQLSKGQRQMLKLCFGISVMEAVANHHGTHFSQIFLDEALDGLDDNNKLKAMNLLEELALTHESVFVVEHSEQFKAMLDNKIEVVLENGKSMLCQN